MGLDEKTKAYKPASLKTYPEGLRGALTEVTQVLLGRFVCRIRGEFKVPRDDLMSYARKLQ